VVLHISGSLTDEREALLAFTEQPPAYPVVTTREHSYYVDLPN